MTTTAKFYDGQQPADAHGVILLIKKGDHRDIQIPDPTPLDPNNTKSIGDWLPVAQVVNISSPNMSKTFHDVTPARPGVWKEHVPGHKEAGSVNLSLMFDSDLGSHSVLLKSFQEDTRESFRILIPDVGVDGQYEDVDLINPVGKFWEFDGYVSSIATSHSAGGIILGNIAIKVTGRVETSSLTMGNEWPDV